MWDDPLERFLERAKGDGFDAVEVYLPAQPEPAAEIASRARDHGLRLVAQITTDGDTPDEHIASMEARFERAVQAEPLLVNSHTGKDLFSFADNLRIFQRACELSEQAGILFTQETHRGRMTGQGPMTAALLEALPELRLNADFSHWFCVHESDLRNQEETVELAVRRASHVHARVGFAEGPQVPDPLAPAFREWTDRHVELWQRIVEARVEAGAEFLTIAPEFGPPLYMPLDPVTGRPLADAWEVNVRFKDYLKTVLDPA